MSSDYFFLLPEVQSNKAKKVIENMVSQKFPLNIGLFFDKYVAWYEERDKKKCEIRKQIFLLRKDQALRIPFHLIPLDLCENYRKRFELLIDNLEALNYKTGKLDLKPRWRLAINLGAASVYETSLLFHRNYGVSVIPGSAVKGVVHHYAEEYRKISEAEAAKIFGRQDKKGEVMFFDALPIIDQKRDFIVLDVMNVHYGDYYQKGEAPGDWMNPNPVFFLTVEGVKFRFTVASKDEKLKEKAVELLKEAVSTMGIGAKTSAGYGYFE
ncbi:MAG: type III-B CRISPR module RAMP protein Cmr6 [Candidatus Bathyarchaeota archaeon]|nr:type III-B CRISPR module RAMP protein Cmr6 [Candidatus Bathyarchaeota archaeon]